MNRYFEIIAARERKTPEEIEKAIQEALDAAWRSNEPQHIQARKKLLDSPTAPNPQDFIATVVKEVQKRGREEEKPGLL